MTTDYPDWTRLFYLTGTAITIPINIEASAVTLNVNLVATEVALDVTITAVDVTLPVSIDAATVTLNVNLTAATATIDINFSDQSVAVFDAAKWFSHSAAQVFATGTASNNEGTWTQVLSYTVPAGKVAFIGGVAYSVLGGDGPVYSCHLQLHLAGTIVFRLGSEAGQGLSLDTPIRATAFQVVQLFVEYWAVTGTATMVGSIWGYLEVA